MGALDRPPWFTLMLLASAGCELLDPDDSPDPDPASPPTEFVQWQEFDPETDFPEPPAALDNADVEPLDDCLPTTMYDPVKKEIVPRPGDFEPCPLDLLCAQHDGCEAFETTICTETQFNGRPAPVDAEGDRVGCDSLERLPPGECTQFDLCPETGDAPANPAEGDDPLTFEDLPPLPPPDRDPPPGTLTVLDNATRFIPPCLWDDAQDFADTGPWINPPVPTYGDLSADPPTFYDNVSLGNERSGTPTNFVGLPVGAACTANIDCLSDRCERPTVIDDPTCQPKSRVPKTYRTNDEPGFRELNRLYFNEVKGNDNWNVQVRAGLYEADLHAQGLFWPSVAWEANAGAEVRIDATADGNTFRDLVVFNGQVRNASCSWSYLHEARILGEFEDFTGFELEFGVRVDVEGLGNQMDGTPANVRQQCESALAALRSAEETTNRALWDAMIATALWNVYGSTPAGPARSDAQTYLTTYEDAVQDYEDALENYEVLQEAAAFHSYGLGLADLDIEMPLWVAHKPTVHLGPFVLAGEMGVTGKAGIDVLLRTQTEFTDEPGTRDMLVGLEATPHFDLNAYAQVRAGIDLELAGVYSGIQGELGLVGAYMPAVAIGGLTREEMPIDSGPLGACIPDELLADLLPRYEILDLEGVPCPDDPDTTGLPLFATLPTPLVDPVGAGYRADFGYNVGVEGRFLSGEIEAFVQAELLGATTTWTKQLASWEGIRRPYLTLLNGQGIFDTVTLDPDSFEGFALPIAALEEVDLWVGPQRNMVYLPDLGGSLAQTPVGLPADAFSAFLGINLDNPDRWEADDGFCGIFVDAG